MKLSGTAHLAATPEQVWAALNDPAVLTRTIPGCQALTETGPDDYRMTISAGVASIKGTYLGQCRLTDKDEPVSYVLHASGAGGPGTVSAECRVSLWAEGGGTELRYDADAVVGGVIAGVGQRVLAGVAKKMAAQFFAAVDADLAHPPAWSAPDLPEGHRAYQSTSELVEGGRPWGDRNIAVDVRPFLLGGVAGAVIALAGVLVGALVGRRR